jgi:SAM-dependent methyltransferase
MTSAFLGRLLDEASARFRRSGRFAYYYARGKLSSDCIFREILRRGLLSSAANFVDLGCGQGSLFAWLLAARKLYDQGDWPALWPAPPAPAALRGVELMPNDVERALRAFADCPPVDIRLGDMCEAEIGRADAITVLDVLHYVDFGRQERLLCRIRQALAPGGVFLTRVGDAGAGLRFRIGQLVDQAVVHARGSGLSAHHGRRLDEWSALLAGLGFAVHAVPMSEGKPFANVMLVCRPADAVAQSAVGSERRHLTQAGPPFR